MSTEEQRAKWLEACAKWRSKNRDRERERARKDQWETLTPEEYLVRAAKVRAKKKGLPFDLIPDDIEVPDICPILGVKLERSLAGKPGGQASSPSIDRVKPELGYVKGNVGVISLKANTLKSNLTDE